MTVRWRLYGAAVAAALFALPFAGSEYAKGASDPLRHIGVVSCAGDNCHGAVKRFPNSAVAQDEYLIWKKSDKHRLAYEALRTERGEAIAHNLGLKDAETAPICLDCHADNVPKAQQGPRFDIADGVGCEVCHNAGGGAWLGLHIAGVSHKENVAAGLYPTDEPLARADECMSCHVGIGETFVTHKIMGAGHPPMPFELDTYTAIQPAHFHVTEAYIARKGRPNDMQIWAIGQAIDLKHRMDLLIDPKNAPKGANPELSLFDCQACHHAMDQLQWRKRASTGLEPGRLRLYDATAVMLQVAATRVAPDAAAALSKHMRALHDATTAASPDYWKDVVREGTAVRDAAAQLIPALQKHNFDKADAFALAKALVAVGTTGDDLDYSRRPATDDGARIGGRRDEGAGLCRRRTSQGAQRLPRRALHRCLQRPDLPSGYFRRGLARRGGEPPALSGPPPRRRLCRRRWGFADGPRRFSDGPRPPRRGAARPRAGPAARARRKRKRDRHPARHGRRARHGRMPRRVPGDPARRRRRLSRGAAAPRRTLPPSSSPAPGSCRCRTTADGLALAMADPTDDYTIKAVRLAPAGRSLPWAAVPSEIDRRARRGFTATRTIGRERRRRAGRRRRARMCAGSPTSPATSR